MRRLANGIVLVRAAPAMGSAAAGGGCCLRASNASYLAEACGRSPSTAWFASFEMAARRGGPGGVPTTPGAARTIRSRPDASELETLVSHLR